MSQYLQEIINIGTFHKRQLCSSCFELILLLKTNWPCKLTDEEVVNLQGTLLHDLHGQKSSTQWVHASRELYRGLLVEWNCGAEDVLRQSDDPTASHVVVPDANFSLLEQTKNLVKA